MPMHNKREAFKIQHLKSTFANLHRIRLALAVFIMLLPSVFLTLSGSQAKIVALVRMINKVAKFYCFQFETKTSDNGRVAFVLLCLER